VFPVVPHDAGRPNHAKVAALGEDFKLCRWTRVRFPPPPPWVFSRKTAIELAEKMRFFG